VRSVQSDLSGANVQQRFRMPGWDLGPLLGNAPRGCRIGQNEVSPRRLEADEVGSAELTWKVALDDAFPDAALPAKQAG